MNTPPNDVPRIAIVGGGWAGLAAAWRLGEWSRASGRSLEVTLFEAGSRLGGAVATIERDGYLIERGADAFLAKPPILDLCERLGLSDELLPTDEQYRGALILRNGKPVPVPAGFQLMMPTRLWPLLSTPLLSIGGKLRLLGEAFVPRRNDGVDETLESFVTRRLGRQAFERLVQPLTSGIYTADPEKLSLAATLPRFIEMERRHGSLIRAGLNKRDRGEAGASGARYGLFVGPQGGMEQILTALRNNVSETANIRLGVSVCKIERNERNTGDTPVAPVRWIVTTSNDRENLEFDAVILAVPAFVAAQLLRGYDAALAGMLNSIPYASSAVVATGHRLDNVRHPLDAFGLVIPTIEKRDVLAISFASRKFPGRAPKGHVLSRTFVGGAMRPDQIGLSDEEMIATVRRELGEFLGVRGGPEVVVVSRFERAMPQYHVGHLELVARIEAATKQWPGLELAGSAYRGVGIPDVVAHAMQAADRVIDSSRLAPQDETSRGA